MGIRYTQADTSSDVGESLPLATVTCEPGPGCTLFRGATMLARSVLVPGDSPDTDYWLWQLTVATDRRWARGGARQ